MKKELAEINAELTRLNSKVSSEPVTHRELTNILGKIYALLQQLVDNKD